MSPKYFLFTQPFVHLGNRCRSGISGIILQPFLRWVRWIFPSCFRNEQIQAGRPKSWLNLVGVQVLWEPFTPYSAQNCNIWAKISCMYNKNTPENKNIPWAFSIFPVLPQTLTYFMYVWIQYSSPDVWCNHIMPRPNLSYFYRIFAYTQHKYAWAQTAPGPS